MNGIDGIVGIIGMVGMDGTNLRDLIIKVVNVIANGVIMIGYVRPSGKNFLNFVVRRKKNVNVDVNNFV
jgi:hypothetical protein